MSEFENQFRRYLLLKIDNVSIQLSLGEHLLKPSQTMEYIVDLLDLDCCAQERPFCILDRQVNVLHHTDKGIVDFLG